MLFVVLVLALVYATVVAQTLYDLAQIPEIETLRVYARDCKNDRDRKEGELATSRAYALRLEQHIKELETQLSLPRSIPPRRETP